MEFYEKDSYLENLQKTLSLWNQLETINMKEEIKKYNQTKLEECIYDKIVHPHDT